MNNRYVVVAIGRTTSLIYWNWLRSAIAREKLFLPRLWTLRDEPRKNRSEYKSRVLSLRFAFPPVRTHRPNRLFLRRALGVCVCVCVWGLSDVLEVAQSGSMVDFDTLSSLDETFVAIPLSVKACESPAPSCLSRVTTEYNRLKLQISRFGSFNVFRPFFRRFLGKTKENVCPKYQAEPDETFDAYLYFYPKQCNRNRKNTLQYDPDASSAWLGIV